MPQPMPLITAHTQHRRTNAEHNIRNNLQNTAVPDNCPHGNRCIDYIIGYYIEQYESKQINNYHTNKICFQQATEINLLSLARPGTVYPCLHDKAQQITERRLCNITGAAADAKTGIPTRPMTT